jgi:predicted AAA+ superfamily ATPase
MVSGGKRVHFFDLEDRVDAARLENPRTKLGGLKGLVILDEVQAMPELFKLLRVLADRRPAPCRFLITGSASPAMIRGVSESLAGRVTFVDMGGFTLDEVGAGKMEKLWIRGGFPPSFLAASDRVSWTWREDFIRTFLERDLPRMEVRVPSETLHRLMTMIAHYHGQVWNSSEVGASLGVSNVTTRRHLDLFTGTFLVRQLNPWFENVGKRLVKSPKVYIRDSGLLHQLLGLRTIRDLEGHPKKGASWEGFAMEQVLARTGDRDAYFWATHAGAELDLVVLARGRKWGFEFKCNEAPRMTKSMAIALHDLKLEHLWVVHPGRQSYPIERKTDALAMADLDRALCRIGRRY